VHVIEALELGPKKEMIATLNDDPNDDAQGERGNQLGAHAKRDGAKIEAS